MNRQNPLLSVQAVTNTTEGQLHQGPKCWIQEVKETVMGSPEARALDSHSKDFRE